VAVSADGRRIVSGSYANTVAVWDLQAGCPIHKLEAHQRSVNSVAVSPDGRHIVSGSSDETLAVWDLQARTLIRKLEGHNHGVTSEAVSPDSRRIVSGSWDNTIAVWDLQTGRLLATLTLDGDDLSVAWHLDGRVVVVGDAIGNLYRLDYRGP
jgi:WD40 repeat protein